MEAGADFQEAADSAVNDRSAGGWLGDAGEDLQEGALAGAVSADDADDLAWLDPEGDIPERPEGVVAVGGRAEVADSAEGRLESIHEGFAEGPIGLGLQADLVLLAQPIDYDRWFSHSYATSAKKRSLRRKL